MSIQAKFAVLIAGLAAAVLVALGVSKWALDVVYQEVREPVRSASNVLKLLVDVEQRVDDMRGMLDSGASFRAIPGSPEDPQHKHLDVSTFSIHVSSVQNLMRQVSREEWTAFAGRSASENLSRKIAAFAEESQSQLANLESLQRGVLSNQLFQIHEILKKMERRVVEDMQQLAGTGADLRFRLGIVLGLALALVALTAALSLLLVRRWVARPVVNLRLATARIAAGDFDHRIPMPVTAGRDELTALSAEVNHMAAMVKRLQSERVEQERLAAIGEMVRRLAHNLRNPLSGIRGLAELTRSEAAGLGPLGEEVRETQNRIIGAVDRFERWLADLLNVTRPAQIQVEPSDIGPWLAGLVEAHRPLAQTRGVDLQLDQSDGPTSANVDARHLEHAVSAILSNAIDAAAAAHRTGEGIARVQLKSSVIECEPGESGESGQVWELRISDNGSGVAPDLRESIFKPYFTTKKDGNGIGLAVAQQVIRAHNGRIHVEDAGLGLDPGFSPGSTADGGPGAAFIIRLPLGGRLAPATEVASIGH